jgi:hypothetical protein
MFVYVCTKKKKKPPDIEPCTETTTVNTTTLSYTERFLYLCERCVVLLCVTCLCVHAFKNVYVVALMLNHVQK